MKPNVIIYQSPKRPSPEIVLECIHPMISFLFRDHCYAWKIPALLESFRRLRYPRHKIIINVFYVYEEKVVLKEFHIFAIVRKNVWVDGTFFRTKKRVVNTLKHIFSDKIVLMQEKELMDLKDLKLEKLWLLDQSVEFSFLNVACFRLCQLTTWEEWAMTITPSISIFRTSFGSWHRFI